MNKENTTKINFYKYNTLSNFPKKTNINLNDNYYINNNNNKTQGLKLNTNLNLIFNKNNEDKKPVALKAKEFSNKITVKKIEQSDLVKTKKDINIFMKKNLNNNINKGKNKKKEKYIISDNKIL